MLLTIYDKAGTKRADVAVNDSSTQSKEVQGDNVLSLSFSYYDFLPLDVNDYTDYLGERYWLTERYTPKQVNEGEWDYDLRFPQLDLQLRVKYADCTKFTPLTYLWREGVHAGKFRVKFREPKPII